jgi:hypothetical protein
MNIPTVRIKSSHPQHDGFVVINESDFDEAKHELWEEPKADVSSKPAARADQLHLRQR